MAGRREIEADFDMAGIKSMTIIVTDDEVLDAQRLQPAFLERRETRDPLQLVENSSSPGTKRRGEAAAAELVSGC